MAFGITPTGFIPKRLADIKQELEDEFKELFGEIDVNPDSVFGQIIGVMSRHSAEEWEQMENIYYSQYPASANGFSLDGAVQLTGITRLASTQSEVLCQLRGNEGTIIPDGNKSSQSIAGNIFSQVNAVELSVDALQRVVINVDSDTDQTWSVVISGISINYISSSDTQDQIAEGITNAINSDATLQLLVLAEHTGGDDFFTITIVNRIDPVSLDEIPLTIDRIFSLSLGADLSIVEQWTPALYRADVSGAISVPADTVDTIENPISGFNEITNFESGVIGRNAETDSELRIRREESLQILGAATIGAIQSRLLQEVDGVVQVQVIENRTDEWIPAGSSPTGRPPHSFEAIVQGGDSTDIAEKIWEIKPAGIQTDGNTPVTIIDSNGDSQVIEFSRPVTVYVYVRVDYDTNGTEEIFPVNGEDLMRDNIYELGAQYGIGENVLLQKFFSPVYAVPGVTDATIYLATSVDPADPAPSWVAINIDIYSDEIAEFINNSTRIVLNDVTP